MKVLLNSESPRSAPSVGQLAILWAEWIAGSRRFLNPCMSYQEEGLRNKPRKLQDRHKSPKLNFAVATTAGAAGAPRYKEAAILQTSFRPLLRNEKRKGLRWVARM